MDNVYDSILSMKNEPAVSNHVNILQGIMSRLAEMSAKCKDWCFAFTGALLVFLLSSDSDMNQRLIFVPYAIVVMFYIMDCYYIGLERSMRRHYREFIDKINSLADIFSENADSGGRPDRKKVMENIIRSIYYPHLISDKPTTGQRFARQIKSTLSGMASLSTAIPYGFAIIIVIISSILIASPSCPCS